MPSDGFGIEAEREGKAGQRVRLRSLDDLDRRTTAARKVFDLRDAIASDLGGSDHLTAMQRELVNNVALLGAMLQDAAASYLSGDPTDLQEFQGLAKTQRQIISDLGLKRVSRDVTNLQSYIRGAA